MRLIIYTGKGGVGKTSVSAATAKRLAAKGYRTIVMSTDSAHSLADSFDVSLPPVITNVSKNLDVLELDIAHEMQIKWKDIQEYIAAFMMSQGMEELSAEEMAIFPGMEMIAALFYILEFKDNDLYDVVIMDTAPTGETLRLLSFPDVSSWYIDKFYFLFKKLLSVARATVGKIMDMPLPSAEVMDSIEDIKIQMSRVKDVLDDSENTTIRLVVNPERMVINETKRAYTYLSLYGKNVEALVVNRVYPDNISNGYFEDKLEEQKKHLAEIHNSFDPMKIFTANLMPTELVGFEKLDLLADMVFEDTDPAIVYSSESPLSFFSEDGFDMLSIKIPFTEKKEVELYRTKDGSLIIHVGSQKRSVTLPLTLCNAKTAGAEFRDGRLIVKFKR